MHNNHAALFNRTGIILPLLYNCSFFELGKLKFRETQFREDINYVQTSQSIPVNRWATLNNAFWGLIIMYVIYLI